MENDLGGGRISGSLGVAVPPLPPPLHALAQMLEIKLSALKVIDLQSK